MERPLKQRLVGAAVLVVVVVLVLPELLSGRREVVTLEPTRDDSGVPLRAHEFSLGDAPSAEEQAVAADELQPDPVADEMAAAPDPVPGEVNEPLPAPSGVPAVPHGQATPAAAAPPVAPTGVPRTAPVAALPAAPKPGVAPAVAAAQPSAALPAKPLAVPPPKTAATPVQVRAQAAAQAPAQVPAKAPAQSSAQVQAQLPAKAVAPPVKAPAKAPVTLSAWVVQIGSFGTRQKADELVAKLQGKGFRAFTLPYTASGRTLHRVRVGPEQSRKTADEIAKRLEAEGYPSHVAPQE